MLQQIAASAQRLDQWLQARLGRPYNVLLSAGLVIEIIRNGAELSKSAESLHRLAGGVLPILLELALLIHQVGALTHRFEARAARKAVRSSADS